jgi:hypothetical protein
MQITENIKQAAERLKEAQELLYKAIENGNISSIDKDLALDKIRKAYDLILFESKVLKNEEIPPVVKQPTKVKEEKVVNEEPVVVVKEEVKPSPVVQPEVKNELPEEKPKAAERVSIFDPSVKGLSKVGDDKIVKNVEKVFEDIKDAKPEEFSILKTDQPASLVEKFQGKRKTMTESLSNQIKEKPVASQLQDKPISDLTKEIGVHDKFLFIKELFNGDSNQFEKTIDRVNQFTDITEALIYIQENFSWNENNKAANKFIELIRRKLLND